MFKIYIIKENGKFKYLSFKRYEDSESIDDVFTYALIKDQYVNGRYFRTKVSLVRSDKSQEILKTLYTFHRSFFRICVDISFWLNILPKRSFWFYWNQLLKYQIIGVRCFASDSFWWFMFKFVTTPTSGKFSQICLSAPLDLDMKNKRIS